MHSTNNSKSRPAGGKWLWLTKPQHRVGDVHAAHFSGIDKMLEALIDSMIVLRIGHQNRSAQNWPKGAQSQLSTSLET